MKDKSQQIKEIIAIQEKMNQMVLNFKTDKWMKIDLTIDQIKTLILIHSKERISFKDLAQALGITRSNITGIADRLIHNGLLVRQQNPEDRRVQFLVLTGKGKSVLDNLKQEVIEEQIKILASLSSEELDTMKKILAAYTKAAEEFIAAGRNKINNSK